MGWRGGGDRGKEGSVLMVDPVDDTEPRVRVHGRDVSLIWKQHGAIVRCNKYEYDYFWYKTHRYAIEHV